jgi:hypothetical protein
MAWNVVLIENTLVALSRKCHTYAMSHNMNYRLSQSSDCCSTNFSEGTWQTERARTHARTHTQSETGTTLNLLRKKSRIIYFLQVFSEFLYILRTKEDSKGRVEFRDLTDLSHTIRLPWRGVRHTQVVKQLTNSKSLLHIYVCNIYIYIYTRVHKPKNKWYHATECC